jgi:hypothetical protein
MGGPAHEHEATSRMEATQNAQGEKNITKERPWAIQDKAAGTQGMTRSGRLQNGSAVRCGWGSHQPLSLVGVANRM